MLNRIILIGRLTKDPELRYTSSGLAVAKFTLAVDRRQAKDREKETDFIDVVVFQKQAETCANYIGKGRLVAVEGRLQVRSYDDNQGIRRRAAEVIADSVRFLDWPKEGGTAFSAGQARGAPEQGSEISFNDEDDLPF
ncbi:MAG: Single-stranded DNA-binding protein ssb [Firmicutes bacterium ADurb.Bin456]|nr:MAG: Single-stranded DNA-binding protein ssb [Firmicutes bacterium ADurb.Bin456]